MLEFDAGPADRVLDALVAAAGGGSVVGRPLVGSGGTVLVRARQGGAPVLLRAAPLGSPGDPSWAAAALEELQDSQMPEVPRLRGKGVLCGYSWSAETIVPGRRPRRLSRRLAEACAGFCASMPAAEHPPIATLEDLAQIAALLPSRREAVDRLATEVRRHVVDLPSTARHGDFWSGNLLATGGRLTGVIDWDAYHATAMPGADLLQLFAGEARARHGLSLGEAWRQRPWRSVDFLRLSRADRLWPMALRNAAVPDLIGLSWWATEVAGTLGRLPHRALDERWLANNVDAVLSCC